tara:strand:- start:515 stop:694 length:180 start_codon:yes stop_codon:yes gene_type:complete
MAALNNEEVLANLKQQLVSAEETRLKLIGAIDVLQQITDSQTAPTETGTVEVVEQEGGE